MGKRGRKPYLKQQYEKLAERAKVLGLAPPPFKVFKHKPSRLYIAKLVGFLGNLLRDDKPLPSEFRIVGDWVSCIVHPDGKHVDVSGENLKLVQGGEHT